MSSKFKIITKEWDELSKELIKWLADKDVDWQEVDFMDSSLDETILKDEKFLENFCEKSGCVESTPIIVKNDKEYYYSEIWDNMQTVNEEKAKEIFDL